MFNYEAEKMKALLNEIIRDNVGPDVWIWLEERKKLTTDRLNWNTSFAMIPRKTGKGIVRLSDEQQGRLQSILFGFSINDWTIDRLGRVWLLANLDPPDKERYFSQVESLFLSAEVSELVALYSSLPLLAYPQFWVKRCAEGIRSNIGHVLEAIMYNNPYPAAWLDEPAWNQMVLKAIFTDKQIRFIIGLDRRANKELAIILLDYARERWAANRTVNPQLWRLTGKFIDERFFQDIKREFQSEDIATRKAVALAISKSEYEPAKALLKEYPDLISAIENNTLTW
jgi:hypothetical protein